ncbi:hypothetical protein GCM10027047_33200 [Rhodococcus aerolatus]
MDLSGLSGRNYLRIVKFAKTYLRVDKGHGANKPFRFRPWQIELLKGLYPAKGERPRQGLVSLPRGNGKSTLAAVLALYALYADEEQAPQVLVVASDLRQASIIFNTCRRMIEASPELLARTKVFQDRIQVPFNNGVLMPLPADPASLQGWDYSLCVVDELHVVSREIYESMILASGKRPQSLCLAISTPAASEDSVMWDLVSDARSNPRDDFYFREWTSDKTHPVDCAHCWEVANPALDDFLSRTAMRSVLKISHESSFRRLKLGQWLDTVEDQWISPSLWDAVEQPGNIPDGAEVVLALDGSFSGDSTVLVAVSIEAVPHAEIVAIWQPHLEPDGYRVPVADVEQAIRDACKRLSVREIACDPYRWTRTMQELQAERLPVVEFPQSANRMTPATIGVFEAVVNGALTQSGDGVLREHVLNARVKEDSRGTRLAKESDKSLKKIDAAVALVMAHSRAQYFANKPIRRSRVAVFR